MITSGIAEPLGRSVCVSAVDSHCIINLRVPSPRRGSPGENEVFQPISFTIVFTRGIFKRKSYDHSIFHAQFSQDQRNGPCSQHLKKKVLWTTAAAAAAAQSARYIACISLILKEAMVIMMTDDQVERWWFERKLSQRLMSVCDCALANAKYNMHTFHYFIFHKRLGYLWFCTIVLCEWWSDSFRTHRQPTIIYMWEHIVRPNRPSSIRSSFCGN